MKPILTYPTIKRFTRRYIILFVLGLIVAGALFLITGEPIGTSGWIEMALEHLGEAAMDTADES